MLDQYLVGTNTIRRSGQIRTSEVGMWIACVDGGLVDARRLAAGDPLDTPSKDRRRLRWQMIWDVADCWEWVHSTDEGGLLWIASVLDACLGRGVFLLNDYRREIVGHLGKAEATIERLTREVVTNAVGRTNTMPGVDVPGAMQGSLRLLPRAPGQGAAGVGGIRPRPRRQAVAKAAGQGAAARRLAV